MQDLAADTTLGTYTPVQLYAGEAPIVTNHITAASGVAFDKYEVYALDSSGDAVKYVPSGTGANTVIGIFAQEVVAGGTGPVFEAGAFNHAALVWPSGFDDFADRRAAFAGTPIHIMKLA